MCSKYEINGQHWKLTEYNNLYEALNTQRIQKSD